MRDPRCRRTFVDMKLELVPVAVTDVDRAKAFYRDKAGFTVDHDIEPAAGVRIVQLTPPGSACSIMLSSGVPQLTDLVAGGTKGVHLLVRDIEQARAEFVDRGVDMTQIEDLGGGVKISVFSDPDGNTMILQQASWRSGDAY
jgi:predicted enzyme related to lactoylglutathione lyase